MVAVGMVLAALWRLPCSGLRLSLETPYPYLAVLGLMLMIVGFMTFTFTLLLHAAALRSNQAHGAVAEMSLEVAASGAYASQLWTGSRIIACIAAVEEQARAWPGYVTAAAGYFITWEWGDPWPRSQ